MLEFLAKLIFYFVMAMIAIYTVIGIYALIRFGKSKLLSLIISALYLVIMFSLASAALVNFQRIPFSELFNL